MSLHVYYQTGIGTLQNGEAHTDLTVGNEVVGSTANNSLIAYLARRLCIYLGEYQESNDHKQISFHLLSGFDDFESFQDPFLSRIRRQGRLCIINP